MKVVVSVRLPVNVVEQLVAEAEAKRTKVSPLAERIISDHVQRQQQKQQDKAS
jgi:hypothetical protein